MSRLKEPHEKSKDDGSTESRSAIDTSRMPEKQRAAVELAESARDTSQGGFAAATFLGRVPFDLIYPFPEQSPTDREQGDAFLARLEAFLKDHVDPDEIDRTGEIPQEVLDGLAAMGAFGIKIPKEYSGLGLSQTNYCRAGILLGSHCGNLTALLSAHQSIGVPQPLYLFGTEEQKRRFLPRVAQGEISAFALTERNVGSDPARMETRADPSSDGSSFILNGEKLWCTNGTKAGVIVVMARTPPQEIDGKLRNRITAFIVETETPGVEVVHRCRFMGLKALYNAVIRFHNVVVPRENILMAEGKGLRVALTTLNTGRLTLPAACVGLAKRCLEISRQWANERVQWGAPLGQHGAIADKISRIAADAFAMESMVMLTANLVDQDPHADIRLEAAMCKMWGSERAWDIVNEMIQIRGGRGYETAESLGARGEAAIPAERFLRDARINTIFEGSSEIMRLFLAREALDPHLQRLGPLLDRKRPFRERSRCALAALTFYSHWYPGLWLPSDRLGIGRPRSGRWHPVVGRHLRHLRRTSRRLARCLYHSMVIHGPKLEREQLLLFRLVNIGTEVFAMAAVCSRLQTMWEAGSHDGDLTVLGETFCRMAEMRIRQEWVNLAYNADREGYRLSQELLAGRLEWLEDGMVGHREAELVSERT